MIRLRSCLLLLSLLAMTCADSGGREKTGFQAPGD